jgi:hypothetical protein
MGRRGGENMTKRKTYKYIIELSKPVWPRHLVDELLYKTGKVWDADLISVKDLQFGSPPYTFFLLNGDMELHRNRHLFI